jgi:hypothetical protein
MRYVRLRGAEPPLPIISNFVTFGLIISNHQYRIIDIWVPTCWHLEIVVKPRNASFATEDLFLYLASVGTQLAVLERGASACGTHPLPLRRLTLNRLFRGLD